MRGDWVRGIAAAVCLAYAARAAADDQVYITVGPTPVAEGARIGGLVAIGPVDIAGSVMGDVVALGGRVVLRETAVVAGDVIAVCSEVEVAEGATVGGRVMPDHLPELRQFHTGWAGSGGTTVRFGDTEIPRLRVEEMPRRLVVIGGDVHMHQRARIPDLIAVGGDVRRKSGARLGSVGIIGGFLPHGSFRPYRWGAALDPVWYPCNGPVRSGAEGANTAGLSVGQSECGMDLYMSPGLANGGRLTLEIGGEGGDGLYLYLDVAGARRGLNPEAEVGRWATKYDPFHRPRPDIQPLPPDADPLYAQSRAIGVGMILEASGSDRRGRAGTRTVRLGIPTGADMLIDADEVPESYVQQWREDAFGIPPLRLPNDR